MEVMTMTKKKTRMMIMMMKKSRMPEERLALLVATHEVDTVDGRLSASCSGEWKE